MTDDLSYLLCLAQEMARITDDLLERLKRHYFLSGSLPTDPLPLEQIVTACENTARAAYFLVHVQATETRHGL